MKEHGYAGIKFRLQESSIHILLFSWRDIHLNFKVALHNWIYTYFITPLKIWLNVDKISELYIKKTLRVGQNHIGFMWVYFRNIQTNF